MLSRLFQWWCRMYQEGLHPSDYDSSGQVPQYGYAPQPSPLLQIQNTLKGRKINMNSKDIAQVVSDLTVLLGDAERVQEETSTKVDDLTEIKDGLEEANSSLSEAVSALEGLEEIVETVENLLNDADNEGIN